MLLRPAEDWRFNARFALPCGEEELLEFVLWVGGSD